MTYGKITKEQFDQMQFDAGILLKSFDLDHPLPEQSDIICVTTGGISINVEPEYEDTGEDVYMMPLGQKEMLVLVGWSVVAGFTSMTFNSDTISLALGASDKGDSTVPRAELQDKDFADVWWIGDKVDGGFVAVRIRNALSEDGLQISTQKKGKGQLPISLKAHQSLESNVEELVEFFSYERLPFFFIKDHKNLMINNPGNDLYEIDQETGVLTITENDEWHYYVNLETGRAEVYK